MCKKMPTVIVLALISLLGANALAGSPDLASMDWSVKAPHSLVTNPPSDDVVSAFIGEINDESPPIDICSARFANLRRSGQLSLVVSLGRMCLVTVIDKTATGFQEYDDVGAGWAPEIKDLGGNGKLELITYSFLSNYYGANHCMATWPTIYAWTGSTYSDVSSQYKNYYEGQLAALKKRIAVAEAEKERARPAAAAPAAPVWNCQAASVGESAAPAAPETKIGAGVSFDGVGVTQLCSPAPPPAMPEPDRLGLDCDKAEAAKLERFLGVSRDAGMSDAIRWADSDNPNDREFAADVLADIGTPQAIEYIKTLSHDSNRSVAVNAKTSLQQLGKLSKPLTVIERTVPFSALAPSSE